MEASNRPKERKHFALGNPTYFDRELREASQRSTPCRYRISPDDDWTDVIVKYVDQYFIKIQEVDNGNGTFTSKPRWLNKGAILDFEIGGGK